MCFTCKLASLTQALPGGVTAISEREPSAEQVHRALEDLLGWQEIARSPQLARFLSYIVEKRLSGEDGAIKAYSIAVDVFGRPPSFDPQADPIVRVQARRLRAMLDQFRAEGRPTGPVAIRLPVGRYVPVFEWIGGESEGEGVPPPATVAALSDVQAPAHRQRPTLWKMLAAGLVLIGLASGLVYAALNVNRARDGATPAYSNLPERPRVEIGLFFNETGIAAVDRPVSELPRQMLDALGQFDDVEVVIAGGDEAATGPGFLLWGAVRSVESGLQVSAYLTRQRANPTGRSGSVVWSRTLVAPLVGAEYATALGGVTGDIVSPMAAYFGPLHKEGRDYVSNHPDLENVNGYVCQLLFREARAMNRSADIAAALTCLDRQLARDGQDVISLAAQGALEAMALSQLTRPDEPHVEKLSELAGQVLEAVAKAPESSFVREQMGTIYDIQHERQAAIISFDRAMELNPANQDARAGRALIEALAGFDDYGLEEAAEARAAVEAPPPWYFLPEAFDKLRRYRFEEALAAGLKVSEGDIELGHIISLIAAKRVGNEAVVADCLAKVMGNERFRLTGIMPRLGHRISDQSLLKLIRDGLLLAGVPAAALEKAF